MVPAATLEFVCESKICDLMPCDQRAKRWEASGVLVKDRRDSRGLRRSVGAR